MILHSAVLLLLLGSVFTQDIRRPPSIDKGPPIPNEKEGTDGKLVIYRTDTSIVLNCDASGSPEPEYTWFKNMLVLDTGVVNIKTTPGTGTIEINPINALDEGYYQCFAENTYGKAISEVVFLQRAKIAGDAVQTDPITKEVSVGDSLRIDCNRGLSVPPPIVSWALAETEIDTNPTEFQMSERIQMDAEGNLYFANVLAGDHRGNYYYKCNQFNQYLDIRTGGSYTRVNVNLNSGSVGDSRPVTAYALNQVTGLLGESITLKCLFSGMPTPNIAWEKVDDRLPGGRYEFKEYKTELLINNLDRIDEGDYKCTGRNRLGDGVENIYLTVDEKPVFTKKPANLNVTVGDTATFSCKATGKPTPKVTWFINGDPVNTGNPGGRRSFNADYTELYIDNVCKDCASGGSDLMNVQCNVSNVHGYAFGDGYLNVLERTVIVLPPENQELPEWGGKVMFKCEAVSDDSTPVSIDWKLNGEDIIYQEGRLEKLADNSLLVNAENEDDSGKKKKVPTATLR